MLRCYEDGSESPREGCSCKSCYRARELLLPEELIRFIYEPPLPLHKLAGPSREIIHRYFNAYAGGGMTLEAMWVHLVKSLAKRDDAHFDEAMTRAMRPYLANTPFAGRAEGRYE